MRKRLFGLLLLFAFLTPYIAPAYWAATLLAGFWISDAVSRRRWPSSLSTWPAALAGLLALWIALSTAFSLQPRVSARHLPGVLVLLALPIAIDLLETPERARAMALTIAGSGVLLAIVGLWQYVRGGDDLANRIRAHLSTYMTFSGFVLLTGCVLLGYLFEGRGRWRAVGAVAVLPLTAMLLTFTRNAYVGALAALLVYLALRRPRGLLLLPPALLLVFWVLPAGQRDRVRSIVDLSDDTNRDRVAMAHAGSRIVRTFPVFGLGPDMVKPYYRFFRDPDAPSWKVPHLHNNTLQLAAQSGLPAAVAYLALALSVIVQAGRRLRRERRPDRAALLAGVFLASVGLFAAGFFEYNFGDTEIQMATLLLWGIPFSAATAPDGREPPASLE